MKIIIPIIVGATIGYFTNWLAIKMLFKPHYEKRIFGIKVPFTPGLIPKEKDRIAKSIGETVGVYLLSPDTIIDALSNGEIDKEIRTWIYGKIEDLKENHQSVKEFLENTLDDNYNKFKKEIKEKTRDLILNQIRKDKFKNLIFKSITEKVSDLECENIYNLIDEKLRELLGELSNSHELKTEITELIKSKLNNLSEDERKLSEILPEEILASINDYIDQNKDEIGNNIRDLFKDPVIQQKLKNSISELVLKNISKMIMAFISSDMIAEKIFHMIEKYINSEDTNNDIVMLIKTILDKLMDSKVSEISSRVLDNLGQEGFEKISDKLIEYIGRETNFNTLLNILREKLRESELENKEAITSYLNKNINQILESGELEASIDLFIGNTLEEFLNSTISSIIGKIDEDSILRLYSFSRNIFDKFAITELPKIIQFFDISKIVEEKIQSFDIDFTERLILDIANKELKAITWLGALLGGIMGILTPLLQMLY